MRWVTLILISGLMFGCGPDVAPPPELPNLVAVTGTVTMDGQPLEGAAVMFMPAGNTGYGAVGGTDAQGKYKPNTATGQIVHDGVSPGEYKVVISRLVGPDGKPIKLDPNVPPANLGGRESLPPKYSSPVQTTLKASVAEGKGTFDFDLKVKP
jgi:hypothetical protein